MAQEKITQKQLFNAIIAMANGETPEVSADKIIEFAEKKLSQLEAKGARSSASRNEEHEAFFEVIRDVLSESDKGMQCGAIAKDERVATFAWADGKETSSQRVSAMLKKMVEAGDVVKTTDKKITLFSLA